MGIAARSGSTIVHNLSWKRSCRVASQVNINLASAPANIDGTVMASGERVLIMAQTAPAENGIYKYQGAGNAMIREVDANASAELEGAAVTIQEGTDADRQFHQTEDGITIDVSAQIWVQISGAGTPVAAIDVTIADAGGRYTGVEVEAALQEIAGVGRTTETVKQNANDIAAIDSSKWTLSATDIFNSNAGNVGIGPGVGAGTVDEQLHVGKTLDGGDVAILIENTEAFEAASTDETVSLKFGSGGNNNLGLIQVGKVNDFIVAGDRDSVMRISILNIDSAVELLTLKGGPATINQIANIGINEPDPTFKLYITGNFQEDTRMVIDTTDGGGSALVSFTKQAMAVSVDIGITSQFIMQEDDSSSPGVFFSRSLSNGNMEIGNGTAIDINTASLKQKVAGTPTFSFTLQNETTTIFWQHLVQGTTRFAFSSINRTIYRIPQSSGNFVISEDIIAGEHLTSAKQVDGDFVAALLLNNQASGAASINETVKLRFGFGTLFNVAEISVGKVNDYVIAADQDSFMALSVDVGGVLTETLRLSENTGVANVGVGGFSSVTIDEILHVARALDGGDVAILIENSFTNTAASVDETASLMFGFGSINAAVEFEAGKVEDFTSGANQSASLAIKLLDDGTPRIMMFFKTADVSDGSIGFGTTDPDARIHVDRDIDGPFLALLLENSRAAEAASTNETVKIGFAFGGINLAAGIVVGKLDDFTTVSKQDTFMELQVLGDQAVLTGVRIEGDAGVIKLGIYDGTTPVIQATKISDPSGGATVDAEARTAVNAIIDALEGIGVSAAV